MTSNRWERAVLASLFATLIVGQFLGLWFGLADNGDFHRVATWFTSNPVGLERFVDVADPAHSARYFDYWLPHWVFQPALNPYGYASSAIVLWAPGVFVNLLLYSRSVLFLPVVSIGARLLVLVVAVGVVRWLLRREPDPTRRMWLILVAGIPAVLALISFDYNVYFNSWYQESASLVFTLLALAAVGRGLTGKPSTGGDILALLLVALAATSKASSFYLPLLLLPLLLGSPGRARREILRTAVVIVVCVAIAGASLETGDNDIGRARTSFNSLYFGALTLSDHPEEHLERLGFSGTEDCVGHSVFSREAVPCFATVGERMSHSNTLSVILDEPIVLARAYALTAGEMQVTALDYLGKQAAGSVVREPPILMKLWGGMKHRLFPTGPLLFASLIAAAGLFALNLRVRDLRREFSWLGLACVAATLIEMGVAFGGDGRQELTKHLLMANVFFDLVALLALGVLVLVAHDAWRRRKDSDADAESAPATE